MAQLAFYARGTLLVSHPTARRFVGQMPRYVGRVSSLVDANGVKTGGFPATKQPFVCEEDSEIGRRLVKLCSRDQSLWPADEATARACRVPFTPVEFVDGEWVAKAPDAEPKPKAKPPKD